MTNYQTLRKTHHNEIPQDLVINHVLKMAHIYLGLGEFILQSPWSLASIYFTLPYGKFSVKLSREHSGYALNQWDHITL